MHFLYAYAALAALGAYFMVEMTSSSGYCEGGMGVIFFIPNLIAAVVAFGVSVLLLYGTIGWIWPVHVAIAVGAAVLGAIIGGKFK